MKSKNPPRSGHDRIPQPVGAGASIRILSGASVRRPKNFKK